MKKLFALRFTNSCREEYNTNQYIDFVLLMILKCSIEEIKVLKQR